MEDTSDPARQQLLDIIDSHDDVNIKEASIRALCHRATWRYLTADILPRTRRAVLRINWLHHAPTTATISEAKPEPAKADTTVIAPPVVEIVDTMTHEPVAEPQPVIEPAQPVAQDGEWLRKLYVKTNAPAWGLLLANTAIEIDVAPHWSVQLPVYYSGVNYFHSDAKFRTFALIPEIRFWPGADNCGFYANAHLGLAWYNYAKGGDYRYQDHLRRTPAYGGGIGAGYRFHFCNNRRWTLEASLGAGVYRLDYDIFENRHDGMITGRRQRTFFCIDQVALSFTYSFDITGQSQRR